MANCVPRLKKNFAIWLYLLTAVAFDYGDLGRKFRLLFPFLGKKHSCGHTVVHLDWLQNKVHFQLRPDAADLFAA
jgi:hypothetical protein